MPHKRTHNTPFKLSPTGTALPIISRIRKIKVNSAPVYSLFNLFLLHVANMARIYAYWDACPSYLIHCVRHYSSLLLRDYDGFCICFSFFSSLGVSCCIRLTNYYSFVSTYGTELSLQLLPLITYSKNMCRNKCCTPKEQDS